ncbi:MAG TPA: putative peptidoglycan glycosyltransferase FtsW [Phycisphaerae bacterium]|nr:putative peptidoglycan glycosyltransferase FtsW [Phycisphaerae bacterium]
MSFPRRAGGGLEVVPALVTAVPMRPYIGGRSRFVLTPLSLSLDQLLFLITAALLCIGLVMVQSADARIRGNTDHWLFESLNSKNLIHACVAILAMTAFWRMDYRWFLGKTGVPFGMLRSPATWLTVITIGLLVAVLVTPFGKEINGARRWFALGPIGFQPSELAKLSLVLFVAAYAVHRASKVRSFVWGFIPLMIVFGMTAALVVKEDFGTTVLIAAVVLLMTVMAGVRLWQLALLVPPIGLVIYKMLNTPWRRERLLAFRDPWAVSQGAGYHVIQSLLTIASGGFRGSGLGNGIQKMGYLPEDNTDFIFAVICEELGFVGALVVIGLFAAFVFVGWRIMCRTEHLFGKMVAFGITAIVGLQAAINVAVVTASMPTKGIALPLISSGGTGWIMNAAAIGVLMSIERVNRQEAAAAARGTRPAEPAVGFPVEVHAVEAVPVVEAQPVAAREAAA